MQVRILPRRDSSPDHVFGQGFSIGGKMKGLFYSIGELVDEYGSPFKHKDLVVVDAMPITNTLTRVTLFWYGEVRIFRDVLEKYAAFNVDHLEGLHMIDDANSADSIGLRIAGVEITDFPYINISSVEAKEPEYVTIASLGTPVVTKIPTTPRYMEVVVNIPWKAS